MAIMQELSSLLTPPKVDLSPPPQIGKHAPETTKIQIPQPGGKPVVISFLRHCGCPFAEKTFLKMRETASTNPAISFIAVSHSTQAHTAKWQQAIGGTNPANLEVVVDDEREVYGAWGLGVSSFWHVMSPQGLYDVYKLSTEEGIANRPTESGYRFQTGGAWAVDGLGVVVWGGVAGGASEIPDFGEAVGVLGQSGGEARASL